MFHYAKSKKNLQLSHLTGVFTILCKIYFAAAVKNNTFNIYLGIQDMHTLSGGVIKKQGCRRSTHIKLYEAMK